MDGQVETMSLSAIANVTSMAAAAQQIGMQSHTMLGALTGNDRSACMFTIHSPITNLNTTNTMPLTVPPALTAALPLTSTASSPSSSSLSSLISASRESSTSLSSTSLSTISTSAITGSTSSSSSATSISSVSLPIYSSLPSLSSISSLSTLPSLSSASSPSPTTVAAVARNTAVKSTATPTPMVVETTQPSSIGVVPVTSTDMLMAATTNAFSMTTAVPAATITTGFPMTTTTTVVPPMPAATTISAVKTTTTTPPHSKSVRTISMKENARDLMNCKRRLDFNHTNYLPLHRPQTVAVARRNERERNRVKLINMTFATLREHIPNGPKGNKNKKMSKVETLRAAIDYIHYLQELVDDSDTVNTLFDGGCLSAANLTTAGLTAASLTAAGLSNGIYQTTAMNSPRPSSCSDSSYEGLSAEEEELLGFTKWF